MLEFNKTISLVALVNAILVKNAISNVDKAWCDKIDGLDEVDKVRRIT